MKAANVVLAVVHQMDHVIGTDVMERMAAARAVISDAIAIQSLEAYLGALTLENVGAV